ncbi:MAG: hypothetical protein AAF802_31865 [Planctomycetota bacterium]
MRSTRITGVLLTLTSVVVLALFSATVVLESDTSHRNGLALSIGPRTLVPALEFKPVEVSRRELDSMVDSIVRCEDWFGSLRYGTFKFDSERTNYPPAIRELRDDLSRDLPTSEITEERFPFMRERISATHLITFDETRFAFSDQSSVSSLCQSMVWDGEVGIGIAGPADNPTNYFLLGDRTECAQRAFGLFPMIGHAGSQYFDDTYDSIADERPNISVSTNWNDREYLVIQTLNDSWIIDRHSHLVLARVGVRDIYLFTEHRDIAQGVLWPMKSTYRRYSDEGELLTEIITTVTTFEVESPPMEAAFEQSLIEGTLVADLRHKQLITYDYDPHRTKDEWKAIGDEIAENERRERERQTRRSLILGKQAPAFGVGRWINSEPISMDEIGRRGARIGFVGVGCGPCDNILSSFAGRSNDQGPLEVLVFSFGDDETRIREKLAPFNVSCPVFVPATADQHTWGDVFESYRVSGMPTVVSITPGGVVDSHTLGMFVEE